MSEKFYAVISSDRIDPGASFDTIEEAVKVKKILEHENSSKYTIDSSTREIPDVEMSITIGDVKHRNIIKNIYQIIEHIPGEIIAITNSNDCAQLLSRLSNGLRVELYNKGTRKFDFRLKSATKDYVVYSSKYEFLTGLCSGFGQQHGFFPTYIEPNK